MRDSFKQRRISALGTLAVFVLFALCVLSVLLSGAGAYRRLVQQGSESYALRTCEQYIATRVRQCARGELVSVESFGECCALVLREDVEETEYLTRIYCHEGWLMELFAAADGEFQPEDGEKLLPARELSLSLVDGLLRASVVDEYGVRTEAVFALRGGEGDGP